MGTLLSKFLKILLPHSHPPSLKSLEFSHTPNKQIMSFPKNNYFLDLKLKTVKVFVNGESKFIVTTADDRVLSAEELASKNAQIVAIRNRCLVGKTVTGTVFTKTNKKAVKTFWLMWNGKKCDTVLLPTEECELKNITDGMSVKCTITELGPDVKQLTRFKSAWCMHPQTDAFEVIKVVQSRFPGRAIRSKSPRRNFSFGERVKADTKCWRNRARDLEL